MTLNPVTDLTKPGRVVARMHCLEIAPLYLGFRFESGVVVKAGKRVIDPRGSQAIWNHSPDGFEWGYGGSGPAQLALALLNDAGLPNDVAVKLHQSFKAKFVARWPGEKNWALTGDELRLWIFENLCRLAEEGYGAGMEDMPDE